MHCEICNWNYLKIFFERFWIEKIRVCFNNLLKRYINVRKNDINILAAVKMDLTLEVVDGRDYRFQYTLNWYQY